MRIRVAVLFAAVCSPLSALGQTNTAAVILGQVLARYPGIATAQGVSLNGNAQWIAGSLKESGTAVLQAANDASSTVQLNLETASRTETRSALSGRTCQWTDSHSISHSLTGPDCNGAYPWFAPTLFLQLRPALLNLLSVSDDGQVVRGGSTYRQVSFTVPIKAADPKVAQMLTAKTSFKVLFVPSTLLPASVEYDIHADKDFGTSFHVRVVYGDYQMMSGLPVPHQIDRYVNNTLQLSVAVTTVSVN